jgi:hypothetical protein
MLRVLRLSLESEMNLAHSMHRDLYIRFIFLSYIISEAVASNTTKSTSICQDFHYISASSMPVFSLVHGHYLIWQLASPFTQTASRDSRQRNARRYSRRPTRFSYQIIKKNPLYFNSKCWIIFIIIILMGPFTNSTLLQLARASVCVFVCEILAARKRNQSHATLQLTNKRLTLDNHKKVNNSS